MNNSLKMKEKFKLLYLDLHKNKCLMERGYNRLDVS